MCRGETEYGRDTKLPPTTTANYAESGSGKNSGKWQQYYATFAVCLAAFASGSSSGWASPMLICLKSDESPVGKMTLSEMSFLETLPTLSGLISIYLYGGIIDKFGRKIAGYLTFLPGLVGWALLIWAASPTHLYVGRFFSGMSAVGGMLVGPVFLSEVVHDRRRGCLMSYVMIAASLAVFKSYVLGDLLSYRLFNVICSIAPTLFPVFFYCLPESPYFLLSRGRRSEAEKSLLWYRGGDQTTVDVELMSFSNIQQGNGSFAAVLKSKPTRRAILLVIFMFSFQQLGGSQVINGYASLIFEDGGDSMNPNTSAMILVTIRLVATYFSSLLVDRVGRRFLMISTFLVMGASLTNLSVYFYLKQFGTNVMECSWVPLACLCTYNLAISIGVGTIPEVIGNEIVPPEIKGITSMVSGTVTLSIMMLCLQMYPLIHEHIGIYANFVYPAFVNFLGAFISYYKLPETRGKSLEEILGTLRGEETKL